MNKLQFINEALSLTGLASEITTLAGLDPESDEGKVEKFLRLSELDVGRKLPNISLKKRGSITLLKRELMTDFMQDMDADGTKDNGLIVLIDDPKVSGPSNNNLDVEAAWKGRLFSVQGVGTNYRILSVDPAGKSFLLADYSGAQVNWVDASQSTDSNGTALLRSAAWAATNKYPVGYVSQDRYLLPEDFKAPDQWQEFFDPGVLEYLSPNHFEMRKYETEGNTIRWGTPNAFTIHSTEAVGGKTRWLVEFWPVPKTAAIIPFRYEGAPTIMVGDDDISGYPEVYEGAISSRLRWYIYRFLKKSMEDVQIEEGFWREVFSDQQKNPISNIEQPRLAPETNRAYWGSVYDA